MCSDIEVLKPEEAAKVEHTDMVWRSFCVGVLCSEADILPLGHNTMPCSPLKRSTMCSNLAKQTWAGWY